MGHRVEACKSLGKGGRKHMGLEIEGGAGPRSIVNRLRVVTFPPCLVPALIETRWHRSGDRAQRQETPAAVLLRTDSFSPRLASPALRLDLTITKDSDSPLS